ncbi:MULTISPECIES: DUF7553 family protein [Natrialbaceae]|uniref:DUF7553 family protein n=1 Tax=Natrialbaceae TaxID=1644061 RepID=UPI00207C2471|nr:hypothetical protein [Natronococcus sp. CG52]
MSEGSHLEQACESLGRASDAADRTVQERVDSIVEGLDEERDGHGTQDEPGPKADRIAELTKKLDGLENEAGDEAREYIATARDHRREYLKRMEGDD